VGAPTLPNSLPLTPIPHPLTSMHHHYRFSIDPASSLPPSLQAYAHCASLHYTVYPDGSIFAEMPGGCLLIDAPPSYGSAK